MRPELVGDLLLLAALVEQVGVALDFPAAVGKDQVVGTTHNLKQVLSHTQGRPLGRLEVLGSGGVDMLLTGGAELCGLFEAFDQEKQLVSVAWSIHDGCRPAWAQEVGGQLHVPKRCGKADARQPLANGHFDAMEERLQLLAAFASNESMKLVDDDEGCGLE